MKKILIQVAKTLGEYFGYEVHKYGTFFPTHITETNVISRLMERLAPLRVEKPLIRLGPRGDGGYLVPDDLEGIAACFSPGVDSVSEFEKQCADLGMEVFLADGSVDGPAVNHRLFHFTKRFVGATTSPDYMTLDSWVNSHGYGNDADLMLQIDVEGCEYEVFLATTDSLMRRFRIIVAEFHALDQLWSRPFAQVAVRAFDKILQTHSCVHIHPNNCCGSLRRDGLEIPRIMEFTFLRRDRIVHTSRQTVFPNPLDCDNTVNPSLRLPARWYGGE